MDYATFLRQAERGEAPALNLLHGADGQLLDDALATATRGFFPDPALAAWGREVFDGRERGVDEIVRSAMTLPFGGGRRLVAVRRAQALTTRGADALAAYAKSPNPASCLLLLSDESLRASRDRRTDHWLLAALPAAAIVELPTRGARELTGWLRQRAAVAWRRRGRGVAEIARALRRPPAVIETITGAGGGSEGLLAWKLRRCWDAECRLKSSGEPWAEMAALVADLCAER